LVAADVWQIGKSAPANGADMSTAVAPFPPGIVSNAVPPSAAAPTEASSLCDRVNVAMSPSKIAR
jgi:hypothetical protein